MDEGHFSQEDTLIANKYMKRWSTSLIIREMQLKPHLDIVSYILGWPASKITENTC
jgi:hypothetical protein